MGDLWFPSRVHGEFRQAVKVNLPDTFTMHEKQLYEANAYVHVQAL